MKALVIGDGCIDEYRYGVINRVNPEAPVPLLNFTHTETKLGMAYNVAANLAAFDVKVFTNIPRERLSKKVRYVDSKSGNMLMRVDNDVKPELIKHNDYSQYDFIVISDYDKGFLSYSDIHEIRKLFDGPIYLDTKKKSLAKFDNIFIKINSVEFMALESSPDFKNLVITQGDYGCIHMSRRYEASICNVIDVCGAGDTFLAAFAYTHFKTKDMAQALKAANKCAGIACSHLGVYALTKEDVECVSS